IQREPAALHGVLVQRALRLREREVEVPAQARELYLLAAREQASEVDWLVAEQLTGLRAPREQPVALTEQSFLRYLRDREEAAHREIHDRRRHVEGVGALVDEQTGPRRPPLRPGLEPRTD